jgi:hypothetical protein
MVDGRVDSAVIKILFNYKCQSASRIPDRLDVSDCWKSPYLLNFVPNVWCKSAAGLKQPQPGLGREICCRQLLGQAPGIQIWIRRNGDILAESNQV